MAGKVSKSVVREVHSSFVRSCMANGIYNADDMREVAGEVFRHIGKMSVAGVKAHITMDMRSYGRKNSKSRQSDRVRACILSM